MKVQSIFLSFFVALSFLLVRCEFLEDPYPEPSSCEFRYESDFYVPTAKGSQLITPIMRDTVGGGTFTAEPQGLDLDSKTGAININTSEAGVQYYLTYTSPDGDNVCETTLTISGIDYPSDTFSLNDASRYRVAAFLDADREQTEPPGIYDQPGQLGVNTPPASESGLAIDERTGTIDLRQTLENIRASGEEVDSGFQRRFDIVYALEDRPESVSTIEVIVFYYETIDQIPQELLDIVAEKNRFPINSKELGKRPPYLIAHGE